MIWESDYHTETYEAEVPVKEYVETCVNVEEFLECCKACPNYNTSWSCPPFDFSPEDYWNRYSVLYLRARKIIFSPKLREMSRTGEELNQLIRTVTGREKKLLSEELFCLERNCPGSVSLSAGHCAECGPGMCTRKEGRPCRDLSRMRYSIEALGGNVGLTITKYMKQELLWVEEGKLPEYFILVCGLLKP